MDYIKYKEYMEKKTSLIVSSRLKIESELDQLYKEYEQYGVGDIYDLINKTKPPNFLCIEALAMLATSCLLASPLITYEAGIHNMDLDICLICAGFGAILLLGYWFISLIPDTKRILKYRKLIKQNIR